MATKKSGPAGSGASLMDRLKKVSTIPDTAIFAESTLLNEREMVQCDVPLLNAALAGAFDGGLTSGLQVIAGPSKHFKTLFCLKTAKGFMDAFEDAVMIFLDSEFGSPQSYFTMIGIDTNRVLHIPVTTIEQARHELSVQLNEIKRKDRVIIVFDSVGNLASKKETEDALAGKDTADMTRAKVLKSLFRIVTPQLTVKDIPMLVVNHTYKEMSTHPKDIVSGGTGIYYSATGIWIIGREQEKEGDDVVGYTFKIRIEKSRFVKEKSMFPITVTFDGGIDKYSGIFELAMDAGLILVPKQGYYRLWNEPEDASHRRKALEKPAVMKELLKNEKLLKYVKDTYQLSAPKTIEEMIEEDDDEPQILTEEA